jgi:hypothetical protein
VRSEKGEFMIGRILILVIIVFHSFLYSEKIYPTAGSTSASFLKIPVGAYYSSLGGSVINDYEDLSSVFYNPSFAAGYRNKNFYLSHNFHISDIEQSYIAFGKNAGIIFDTDNDFITYTTGYFIVSLNWVSIKGLEKRSGLNEGSPYGPSPVEGRFSAGDFSFMLSYAFVYKNLNLGVSAKYISQRIDEKSGGSIAFDIGANKDILIKNRVYNFDFGINNIGRGIKFENERYKLPLLFRTGIWSSIDDYGLKFSFNVLKYIDNYPYFIFGVEKEINSYFSVRTAYKYRFYGNELGFWSGFSVGIGYYYKKFKFDYSLNPYGELGYSHKFSVGFKF